MVFWWKLHTQYQTFFSLEYTQHQLIRIARNLRKRGIYASVCGYKHFNDQHPMAIAAL